MAKKKNNPLATILLTLAGVAIGVASSSTAWRKLRDQRELTDQAREQVHQAESNRSELLRKQSVVETDAGRETIARDRGFQAPNEIPIEPK